MKNHTGVATVFSVSFAIAIAAIVAWHYLKPSPDGGALIRKAHHTPSPSCRQGIKLNR